MTHCTLAELACATKDKCIFKRDFVGRAEKGGRGGDSYNHFDEVEGIRARFSSILVAGNEWATLLLQNFAKSEEILGLFRVRVNPLLGSESSFGVQGYEAAGNSRAPQAVSNRGKAPPRHAIRIHGGLNFPRSRANSTRRVALEEQRAGIFDTSHFAYPTYARAARTRRDNLHRSSEEFDEVNWKMRGIAWKRRWPTSERPMSATVAKKRWDVKLQRSRAARSRGQPMRLRVAQA